MRGGAGWQVTELFLKSEIFQPGQSKHQAKEQARAELQRLGQPATWRNVGARLPIFSYGTAQEYKDVWHNFAAFSKTNLGIRDIEKTTGNHISAYLNNRAEAGVSRATFAKESAALAKLELALNKYSEKLHRGNEYTFRTDIDRAVSAHGRELARFTGSRAYAAPEQMISNITTSEHQLVARIQYESGARVSEAGFIRPEQLRGIGTDKITGADRGCIGIVGKGGKANTIGMSPQTYRLLGRYLDENRELRIDHQAYRRNMSAAAQRTGQSYFGTHGLRWNFAVNRMEELQGHGLSYETALSETAHSMSHNRHDITEHYLD